MLVPLKTAVGLGFTDTIALLVRSPGSDVHLLSFADVSVYVLVEVGDTTKEYVLVRIPLIVTGAEPSI